MGRQELLDREASSWDAFMTAVGRVSAERRTEVGVVPGWSVHDLVWHCGFWSADAASRIEAMAAGGDEEPERPEAVWQAMNDEAAEQSKSMAWDEVVARTEAARERVRAALASLAEVGTAAESEFVEETFEHYDEHTAEIERFAASAPGA
ncbi:MAG: maleylpyruvate isomerase N-terminal domain-containing protein [Actinobacteria bacterium]|nr:maleylpyruvate isomerase N-terminal domain-containing protein [Actinomycetota bacterium]